MGRKALEKGKEIRCRLHDETDNITVQGRFLIIKLESEEKAREMSKRQLYVRPDYKKGPVRIA